MNISGRITQNTVGNEIYKIVQAESDQICSVLLLLLLFSWNHCLLMLSQYYSNNWKEYRTIPYTIDGNRNV